MKRYREYEYSAAGPGLRGWRTRVIELDDVTAPPPYAALVSIETELHEWEPPDPGEDPPARRGSKSKPEAD